MKIKTVANMAAQYSNIALMQIYLCEDQPELCVADTEMAVCMDNWETRDPLVWDDEDVLAISVYDSILVLWTWNTLDVPKQEANKVIQSYKIGN